MFARLESIGVIVSRLDGGSEGVLTGSVLEDGQGMRRSYRPCRAILYFGRLAGNREGEEVITHSRYQLSLILKTR